MADKADKTANMKRAQDLANELFGIANSFAGEETGMVAALLHGAVNDIWRAADAFEGKANKGKISRVMFYLLPRKLP